MAILCPLHSKQRLLTQTTRTILCWFDNIQPGHGWYLPNKHFRFLPTFHRGNHRKLHSISSNPKFPKSVLGLGYLYCDGICWQVRRPAQNCSYPNQLLKVPYRLLQCSRTNVTSTEAIAMPPARKKQEKGVSVLLDDKWAEQIASTLLPHLSGTKDMVVHEAYPGHGLLTKHLLNMGLPRITVWETRETYLPHITEMCDSYQERLTLSPHNFYSAYSRRMFMMDDSQLEQNSAKWEDDPILSIMGIYPPKSICSQYMRLLKSALLSETFPFNPGRPQFLVLVNPLEYTIMMGSPESLPGVKPQRMFWYQILYDIELLLKVPMDAFKVRKSRKKDKMVNWPELDTDSMYLVRMVPKKNLFEQVCPKDQMKEMFYFIKQLKTNTTARLIPKLEAWCPGCGLDLMELGYTMMDRVKMIKIQDYPIIFKTVVSSPEYRYSGVMPEHEGQFRGRWQHPNSPHDDH